MTEASIATRCKSCDATFLQPFHAGASLACPDCGTAAAERLPAVEAIFSHCVLCGYEAFYRQRDFNKVIGLGVIVVAALCVPWTHGLSMPVAALLDAWLYRRTPELARCYGCRAEFRGFALPGNLRGYDHYTAELADKRRPATSSRAS